MLRRRDAKSSISAAIPASVPGRAWPGSSRASDGPLEAGTINPSSVAASARNASMSSALVNSSLVSVSPPFYGTRERKTPHCDPNHFNKTKKPEQIFYRRRNLVIITTNDSVQ